LINSVWNINIPDLDAPCSIPPAVNKFDDNNDAFMLHTMLFPKLFKTTSTYWIMSLDMDTTAQLANEHSPAQDGLL
jgi:hypothetical protein